MVHAGVIVIVLARLMLTAYSLKLAHARRGTSMLLATIAGLLVSPYVTIPVILIHRYKDEEAKVKDKNFNRKLWGTILKPSLWLAKGIAFVLSKAVTLPLRALGISGKKEVVDIKQSDDLKIDIMNDKTVEKELRLDVDGKMKVDPVYGYDIAYAKKCLDSYEKMQVKRVGSEDMQTAYRLKVCNYPDGRQVIFCPDYLKDIIKKAAKDIEGISNKVIVDSTFNESSYMIVQQKPLPTGRMTPVFTETSLWFIPDDNRVVSSDRVYQHMMEKSVFKNVVSECRDINKQLQSEITGLGTKHPDKDFRYRSALSLNIQTNKVVLEMGGNPIAYINYDEKTGKISTAITEKARSLLFNTPTGKMSVAEALKNADGVHEAVGVMRSLVTSDENVQNASVNLAAYLKQDKGVEQSLSQSNERSYSRAEFNS